MCVVLLCFVYLVVIISLCFDYDDLFDPLGNKHPSLQSVYVLFLIVQLFYYSKGLLLF